MRPISIPRTKRANKTDYCERGYTNCRDQVCGCVPTIAYRWRFLWANRRVHPLLYLNVALKSPALLVSIAIAMILMILLFGPS